MFDIKGCQIACITDDEKMSVLKYIEDNYPKVRWNSGRKPMEYMGKDAPMSIIVGLDLRMWNMQSINKYSLYKNKFITANDLLGDFTLPSKEHLMEFLED